MIFKNQFLYDNSLVSIDFNGAREYFLKGFKEDFTAFYEKL